MIDLEFAKQLADPNFSLSVPEPTKAVIRDLVAEVERLRKRTSVQHCWKNDGTAYCGDPNAKPFFPATVEESNAVPACSICHKRVCHSQAAENATLQAQIEADSDVMFAQREEIEYLRSQIDAVKKLHRPAYAVFSWNGGTRYEDPCPECHGAPGVHPCGCWADTQLEYVCAECHRLGVLSRGVYDYDHPCPTIRALDGDVSE